MPRVPKPFIIHRRSDFRSFQITLSPSRGLPVAVCREWKRRSFQWFPPELAHHRYPKTRAAAEAGEPEKGDNSGDKFSQKILKSGPKPLTKQKKPCIYKKLL
jgi:hypothetical protein